MNTLSKRLHEVLEYPALSTSARNTSFYPSSVSVETTDALGKKIIGSCLRQQYYSFTQETESNRGEVDYSFSAMMGDKVSELLVQLIDQHGFKMGLQRLAVEHRLFDPRINLSGRCDIIAWDYKNNEPVGIEVKSVGEYKASKTMEMPAMEHLMQAVLYLDYYRTYLPQEQVVPKKWYIWYCSRTENYSIKAKKHGSPLTMLWDFYITLDDEGVPTVHTDKISKTLPEFSVPKLHARYIKLAEYINNKILPDRDYELEYSPEKITSMYKLDMLTRKADKEAVEKWLKKGAPEGKLKLELGDFECKLCAYRSKCWGLDFKVTGKKLANLPLKGEALPKTDANKNMW